VIEEAAAAGWCGRCGGLGRIGTPAVITGGAASNCSGSWVPCMAWPPFPG